MLKVTPVSLNLFVKGKATQSSFGASREGVGGAGTCLAFLLRVRFRRCAEERTSGRKCIGAQMYRQKRVLLLQ